jgi:hypothetical protein
MLARIHAAPNVSSYPAALQIIANAVFALNRLWIRDMLRAGKSPPRSVRDCAPPWCARPIVYRPYHGRVPAAPDRDYYDGPMLFHRAEATCLEVSAYDAAALAEIERVDAGPEVLGEELTRLHCVVRIGARTIDPTAGLRPGETITRPWQ